MTERDVQGEDTALPTSDPLDSDDEYESDDDELMPDEYEFDELCECVLQLQQVWSGSEAGGLMKQMTMSIPDSSFNASSRY